MHEDGAAGYVEGDDIPRRYAISRFPKVSPRERKPKKTHRSQPYHSVEALFAKILRARREEIGSRIHALLSVDADEVHSALSSFGRWLETVQKPELPRVMSDLREAAQFDDDNEYSLGQLAALEFLVQRGDAIDVLKNAIAKRPLQERHALYLGMARGASHVGSQHSDLLVAILAVIRDAQFTPPRPPWMAAVVVEAFRALADQPDAKPMLSAVRLLPRVQEIEQTAVLEAVASWLQERDLPSATLNELSSIVMALLRSLLEDPQFGVIDNFPGLVACLVEMSVRLNDDAASKLDDVSRHPAAFRILYQLVHRDVRAFRPDTRVDLFERAIKSLASQQQGQSIARVLARAAQLLPTESINRLLKSASLSG
jgi:hypothetical protein